MAALFNIPPSMTANSFKAIVQEELARLRMELRAREIKRQRARERAQVAAVN